MPRVTHLFNHHMEVLHRREPVEGEQGTSIEDIYEFVFTDRVSGDQIRVGFGKETRDQMVTKMSGITVAASLPPNLK